MSFWHGKLSCHFGQERLVLCHSELGKLELCHSDLNHVILTWENMWTLHCFCVTSISIPICRNSGIVTGVMSASTTSAWKETYDMIAETGNFVPTFLRTQILLWRFFFHSNQLHYSEDCTFIPSSLRSEHRSYSTSCGEKAQQCANKCPHICLLQVTNKWRQVIFHIHKCSTFVKLLTMSQLFLFLLLLFFSFSWNKSSLLWFC